MPTGETHSQKKYHFQLHFPSRIKCLCMPPKVSHRSRAEWDNALSNWNNHYEHM